MRKLLLLSLGIIFLAVSCPVNNDKPDDNTEHNDPGDEDPGGVKDPLKTAMDAVREMKLGVNIGNSFDSLNSDSIATQTGWGNPAVSQDYIKSLKSHGFTTVRFPVSWADYIGDAPQYVVNATWMERVARVVDWVLAEDMYCVLNVHHDGADIINKSWIEEIRFTEREEEILDKFASLWRQIAEKFNYASDLLVFEGMNEPQFDKLWPRNDPSVANKTRAFYLLNTLNQTFVDTVRETGGNNAERLLLVPGYWTDIDMTIDNWGTFFNMPEDKIENRIILSLHYYTPWNFCGGNSSTWGTVSNRTQLNNLFEKVKSNIIDNYKIPVIIGEYAVNINNSSGAVSGTPKNSASRVDWMISVTQKCVDLGICPILWDTGMRTNNKGMADVERQSPFNITDDLRAMIEGVVWQ